jgi:hypothetical protein
VDEQLVETLDDDKTFLKWWKWGKNEARLRLYSTSKWMFTFLRKESDKKPIKHLALFSHCFLIITRLNLSKYFFEINTNSAIKQYTFLCIISWLVK